MQTSSNILAIAAVEHLLAKMFNTSAHFCICDFDRLMKVAGITVPTEERDVLSAFHCVNYCDMSKGVKEMLASKVVELLRRQPDWKLEIKVVLQQPLQLT